MCFFVKDIGIDLGTANTLIYIKKKGIILNEPSVIAVDAHTKEVLATGKKAKEMVGRAPDNIRVVRPLQDGVISDFEMTASMLKTYIKRVLPESSLFTKVRVVVGVPSGVTEVEKRAVEEVVRQMGAKMVFILEEPMAAAIGSGLAVDSAMGCMIADIGGGTSDIAIIALGGIVTNTSLRYAGDKQNDAIIAHMRKRYNLLIGDKTAEEIKITVGCAYIDSNDPDANMQMEARGRDIITGLPNTVTITSIDISKALEEPIKIIIDGIKSTLEKAPPEIAADIVSSGLILSGGGGLLRGLDKLIERSTGLNVVIAENALEAVAEGTGKSLISIEKVQKYAGRGMKKRI
ncbi:MAG: rod shape-determining protein [Eubacteriales bacterium]|nr:rod shape-determining protein [Eubacteriales bacterium]MDD3199485.1 rod shape-determining protein [Eubacteriales bacterium]MDD4121517.1 rod shape-determining protein [Eubacteriales bacterium]MDD4629732.1 rod shape-determining protein [Eubacteriales bacterium]